MTPAVRTGSGTDPETVVRRMYAAANVRRAERASAASPWRRRFEELLAGFPDLHVVVGALVSHGGHVGAYVSYSGTHCGWYAGVPATSRRIRINGVDVHCVRATRVICTWSVIDLVALMNQLGATRLPPARIKTVGGRTP